jgi:L-seryl-tRNA(Ser) seleniumtransferase
MSIYESLGVRRVVNACGLYTDLGGSSLGGAAWEAAVEANATWASLDELLVASGERIAALCGAAAARVVPGASAGIALAVGACIARGEGRAMEALPLHSAFVVMQRGHEYKYARCAKLAGARVEFVDDIVGAMERGPAAVLHPAHLDGVGVPLETVAAAARSAGVPVVVDAAYMSFPLTDLGRWASGGDVACFSAKYFWGPNGGGFVAGRAGLVADVAALDFTGYESGPWLTFGRAWKLDRATVCATVAALEEWFAVDHDARLRGYASLAESLAARVGPRRGARGELRQFTLDERVVDGPVNAVVLRGAGGRAGEVVDALAAGTPSVRAMLDGDAIVLCTEALRRFEIDEIALALSLSWPN